MKTAGNVRPTAVAAWRLTLCLIVIAALAARLYGLNWDQGADLHPDELFVAKIVLIDRIKLDWPPNLDQVLDPARSGLNPRSADPTTGHYREYAYGALPLFVTDFLAWILSRVTGESWNAMDRAYLVGRSLSAVLSALTIVPIALLGRRVGGPSIGLLAALFAALAPMSIQLAHFFTTDSWLAFFVACALLASCAAATGGALWQFSLAGAAFGLAMASKGSVFTLVIPIVVAVFYNAARTWTSASPSRQVVGAAVNLLAAGLSALAAFFIFEPFALLRPDVYIQSLATQADIVSGRFDVPFTRIYAGTTPFLYQLEQFVRWGYGPVAGFLALAGVGLLAAKALRGAAAPLILMSWAIPYCAVLIVADVKFLRYLEPLAPVLAIGAGLALQTLGDTLATSRLRPIARVAAPALLVSAVFWTAAFLSIYAHENPRVAATKWIYATIAPGANLTAEYWDDSLPRSLAYSLTPTSFGFGSVQLDLYHDLPPQEASDAIYDSLSRADYVIQSSERVETAVRAAPWRYPVQGRFFQELEGGNLGFSLAKTFERRPSALGVAVDDRHADESFINYDHPQVSIYQRTEALTRPGYDALMSWAIERPWFPHRAPPEPTLLLDTPVGQNPAVDDARWSADLTESTAGALAVWIVLLAALQLAGLPIVRAVFPSFPDAGWGLARTLAILVAAYPLWLGASLHLVCFRALWAIGFFVIVTVAGWILHWRRVAETPEPGHRVLGPAWRHAEVAFWLVFAVFLSFRLILPDGWHPFWGGEKPMEFALINAIGRSAYFPPYDPWFADGYVNYYYYGFYLVAFLGKLTGIPVEIAFNLALPTMMGLLASGGFSVASMLARGVTRSHRLGIAGGWVSVAALALAGNLSSARTLFEGVPDQFDPFVVWVWNGSRAIDNAITEFPFFTGLYADLHAHVVALPITIVAIALSLSVASIPSLARLGVRGLKACALPITLLALTIGTLGVTNAWDVPIYAALALASLFVAAFGTGFNARRLVWFAGGATIVGGGAWVLFMPFHTHFVALFSQVAFVRDPTPLLQFLTHFGLFVVVCSAGLSVLYFPTPASRLLTSGPWITTAVGGIGLLLLTVPSTGSMVSLGEFIVIAALASTPLCALWSRMSSIGHHGGASQWICRALVPASALALVASALVHRPVLGLGFALGSASVAGWLMLKRRPEQFTCLLLAAAFYVVAGVEIVVVADDLIDTVAYRMNTVFKFYNQVWMLLSLATAALVPLMARGLLTQSRGAGVRGGRASVRLAWSRFGTAIAALLFLASLTYPAMAIGPRLAQRFEPGSEPGSLNALDWMQLGTVPVLGSADFQEIAYRGDAEAIAWLLDNVDGSPVIAEASIGPYRCNGSRISAATGLPTIIGWERHQQQQRYPEDLPARVRDVHTLFTSADIGEKAAILSKYNVEYVIVGDLERAYPVANNECSPTGTIGGIKAFNQMVGTTLDVAYAAGPTSIYRVRARELGSGA